MDPYEIIGRAVKKQTPLSRKEPRRKCPLWVMERGWEFFWHPVFRKAADSFSKMQWAAFEEALATDEAMIPHRRSVVSGFTYLFGRYSKYCADQGLLISIYTLIASIPSGPEHAEQRMALFREMYNSPRVTGPHSKISWKFKAATPDSLSQYGKRADLIFRQELLQAEQRTLKRLQEHD